MSTIKDEKLEDAKHADNGRAGEPLVSRARPRKRAAWIAAAVAASLAGLALADPMPFRQLLGIEYYDFPLPRGHDKPSEWVFARLMYPESRSSRYYGWGGDWRQGGTS